MHRPLDGGIRAMYLAALDDRIKVTVISNAVASFKSLIEHEKYFLPPAVWLPGILAYADCQDILSLIAPRPLLVISGTEDETIPPESMQEAYTALTQIYSLMNGEDKLTSVIYEGGHGGAPEEVLDEAYHWFDRWL